MKRLSEELKEKINKANDSADSQYQEAIKDFNLGDRVEYHTEFGWVPVGTKGTVTTCRTGSGKLVVTLDGEKSDNTYQLSKKFIRHIKQ